MSEKGHTTSLAERVEIGERWANGQTDRAIAEALDRPISTIRKWRRRYQQQGRKGLASKMGRPRTGALGHFPSQLVEAIDRMRRENAGWGALTIRTELQKEPGFGPKNLPSRSRIAAYLKQQGYVRPYEQHEELPQPPRKTVERVHQEWEVDAQGVLHIPKLGDVSILLIEDVLSHLKVGALPCWDTSHPNTQDNQMAFRRAFLTYGLPEQVSLDHDSVYIDNKSPSPFPTLLHQWLLALGIAVRFIELPPPAEHAHIERGHQLVDQQGVLGHACDTRPEFHTLLDDRLEFLNREFPSRSLQGQAPLAAFPQALQTTRPYRLEWEADLLDLHHLYAYLVKCCWYRTTSSLGMFSLGNRDYFARARFKSQTLEITFDPHTVEFICLPESSDVPFRLPACGLDKQTLMGELDPLLSMPVYQLALPFASQQWRTLFLADHLPGTTF
jgi:transposase